MVIAPAFAANGPVRIPAGAGKTWLNDHPVTNTQPCHCITKLPSTCEMWPREFAVEMYNLNSHGRSISVICLKQGRVYLPNTSIEVNFQCSTSIYFHPLCHLIASNY